MMKGFLTSQHALHPLPTTRSLRRLLLLPSFHFMKAKDKVKVASFPSANPFTTKWSGAPPNETEEEAQVRVKLMQEAVRVSKEIDQSLNEARKAIEKKKKAFKVLLLGMLHFAVDLTP
jgi:hypothetical protein